MAPAQILGSNVHKLIKENLRAGLSPTPFCRTLTEVADNFHPVQSSEELESEPKWYPAFELLGNFFIFASILMRPSGPQPPVLLDNETNWWQHWQRWWSQNIRLTKVSFPVSGYQPIGLRVEEINQTDAVCSIPRRHASSLFSYCWWQWNSSSSSLGGEIWCRRDKIRNLVRIKRVSENEGEFKKKNERGNVIGTNGRQCEV